MRKWLLKPLAGKNLTEEEVFNCRNSRCRRVIESTFCIPVACCRIFHTPILARVENIEKYVLATLTIHNFNSYLPQTSNAVYNPYGFVMV